MKITKIIIEAKKDGKHDFIHDKNRNDIKRYKPKRKISFSYSYLYDKYYVKSYNFNVIKNNKN